MKPGKACWNMALKYSDLLFILSLKCGAPYQTSGNRPHDIIHTSYMRMFMANTNWRHLTQCSSCRRGGSEKKKYVFRLPSDALSDFHYIGESHYHLSPVNSNSHTQEIQIFSVRKLHVLKWQTSHIPSHIWNQTAKGWQKYLTCAQLPLRLKPVARNPRWCRDLKRDSVITFF